VKVDAEENDQLRIYALGAMRMFDFLYRFDIVRMSIFQPRLGNVQTWEDVSADSLTDWAETVLARLPVSHGVAKAAMRPATIADSARQKPNAEPERMRTWRLPSMTSPTPRCCRYARWLTSWQGR
jgi:hypothetical protein